MEGRLIIFVVFVTVLQGSIAEYSPNACVKQSGLEMDLGRIELGKQASFGGLKGTIRSIYSLKEYVMSQLVYGNDTETERAAKSESMKANAGAGIMIGIPCTIDAIKVLQPSIVSETSIANSWTLLSAFVNYTYAGIELCYLDDYEEAQSQLSVISEQITALGNALSTAILGAIMGDLTFSDETQSLIECTQDQVTSNILGSFSHFISALKVLHAQVFTGTEADFDESLKQLRYHEEQSNSYIQAEVIAKYVLIENIYLSQYLENVGIIDGLFALQAAAPIAGVNLLNTAAPYQLQ